MNIAGHLIEYTWLPETRYIVAWDGEAINDEQRAASTWWVRCNDDGSWDSARGFWKQMPYQTRGKTTYRWVHP